MNKKIKILILITVTISMGYLIYVFGTVYSYEKQKTEWETSLRAHEETFENVVKILNFSGLADVMAIDLSDNELIGGSNSMKDTPNNEQLTANLTEIRELGINLIIRYDTTGWSFIKQFKHKETDIAVNEIGIYYSEQREKTNVNHIYNNWFFRNTDYICMEDSLYKLLYRLMKNIV